MNKQLFTITATMNGETIIKSDLNWIDMANLLSEAQRSSFTKERITIVSIKEQPASVTCDVCNGEGRRTNSRGMSFGCMSCGGSGNVEA